MDPSYLGRPVQAPTTQRRGLISGRTLTVLVLLVLAIAVGLVLLIASGDRSGPLQARVSARQTTTLRLVADGKKNLSSDQLTKLNAELQVVLISDNVTLQSALAGAGLKKVDKKVTAAETDSLTFMKLQTAKVNGQYDSTYRGVLLQKLDSLRGLLKELYSETKNKQLKAAVNAEYKHLSGYYDTLEKIEL